MSTEAEVFTEVTSLPVFPASQDAQSDLGDGSSSLSDIEDKEQDQDDLDDMGSEDENDEQEEQYDDDDNDVDMESELNDSEAETERLENSPHTARRHKDVVLSALAESQTYERSPSKLQHSYAAEGEDDSEELDDLSDEEGSTAGSTKSYSNEETKQEQNSTVISIDGTEEQRALAIQESFNRKRKRSLLPERRSPDVDEIDEPARKRTGSVARADEYAIDDAASAHDDHETSNPISGELSEADTDDLEEDELRRDENMEDALAEDELVEEAAEPDLVDRISELKPERHRRSKSRKSIGAEDSMSGIEQINHNTLIEAPHLQAEEGDEHEAEAENEADEAEAALRNEEELEKKRTSIEMLTAIQRQFDTFRESLHHERMAQLEREEAMLKSDPPTHPQYLAMMKCIDDRRDDKLRIEANLTRYRLESIQREAVAKRSQTMGQYHQEVREIRERTLEKTGRTWYDIQNDRRGYGSHVEDFAFKFPTKRPQQIMHHNQYTKEVSLLSGIAKHVGFPAAPSMAGASRDELDADLEKMGKSHQRKQASHRIHQGLPDLAALRAATSTSSFKPAEEQFIEQTPWANPQHPSHAHFIQRQSSSHQASRNGSPYIMPIGGGRRQPHQTGPVLGTFYGTAMQLSGGMESPLNQLNSSLQQQKVAVPSPMNSRPPSQSPDLQRHHNESREV